MTAWSLLAAALHRAGIRELPTAAFTASGKPYFENSPLHFSISHSGNLAAALLSDSPCAVDLEQCRSEIQDRLYKRCLSPEEQTSNCDFFECWTKKECIGKLDGTGISAHPAQTSSLDSRYAECFHTRKLTDVQGSTYVLTTLCTDKAKPHIQKIEPEVNC